MPVTTNIRTRKLLTRENYANPTSDPITGEIVYEQVEEVNEILDYPFLNMVTDSTDTTMLPKQKVRVSWVPRIPLKEPKKPTLHLKREPVLKARRPTQGNSSWTRANNLYYRLKAEVQLKNNLRSADFEKRLLKYERRLKKYKENVLAAKLGILSYRSVSDRRRFTQWNPYSRQLSITNPIAGWIRRDWNDLLPDESQHVSERGKWYSHISGNLPGLFYDASAELLADTRLESLRLLDVSDKVALKRLYDDVNGETVHIGNIIAERHQTLTLLRDSLHLLRNLVSPGTSLKSQIIPHADKKMFKEGDLKTLRLKASDATLAFLFGVKPLINDIFTAVELLKKPLLADENSVVRVRGSSRVETRAVPSSGVVLLNDYYPDIIGTEVNEVSVDIISKTSYVLEFQIENPTLVALESLGLASPGQIAWEMMPWSFLLDWVLPIGQWLKQLDSLKGLQFYRGSKTVATTRVISTKTTWPLATPLPSGSPLLGVVAGQASGSVYIQEKERVLLTEAPIPSLPAFKNPLSITHCIEAVALVSQRFR